MERGRNDSGRYNDRIEPDSVLEVFDERDDQAEPLTASDIVDRMDIARRTAHNKLNALTERGVLETKKVGARGRIWWIPDNGQQNGHSRPSEQSGAGEGSSSTDRTGGSSEREKAEKNLRDLDLAGSGEDYERRVESVLTMYDYLRENPGERISRSDFKGLLEGTDVGYASFQSFWGNWVKKNKSQGRTENTLAQLPNVEIRGDDYVYMGEQ